MFGDFEHMLVWLLTGPEEICGYKLVPEQVMAEIKFYILVGWEFHTLGGKHMTEILLPPLVKASEISEPI